MWPVVGERERLIVNKKSPGTTSPGCEGAIFEISPLVGAGRLLSPRARFGAAMVVPGAQNHRFLRSLMGVAGHTESRSPFQQLI